MASGVFLSVNEQKFVVFVFGVVDAIFRPRSEALDLENCLNQILLIKIILGMGDKVCGRGQNSCGYSSDEKASIRGSCNMTQLVNMELVFM